VLIGVTSRAAAFGRRGRSDALRATGSEQRSSPCWSDASATASAVGGFLPALFVLSHLRNRVRAQPVGCRTAPRRTSRNGLHDVVEPARSPSLKQAMLSHAAKARHDRLLDLQHRSRPRRLDRRAAVALTLAARLLPTRSLRLRTRRLVDSPRRRARSGLEEDLGHHSSLTGNVRRLAPVALTASAAARPPDLHRYLFTRKYGARRHPRDRLLRLGLLQALSFPDRGPLAARFGLLRRWSTATSLEPSPRWNRLRSQPLTAIRPARTIRALTDGRPHTGTTSSDRRPERTHCSRRYTTPPATSPAPSASSQAHPPAARSAIPDRRRTQKRLRHRPLRPLPQPRGRRTPARPNIELGPRLRT